MEKIAFKKLIYSTFEDTKFINDETLTFDVSNIKLGLEFSKVEPRVLTDNSVLHIYGLKAKAVEQQ